MKKPVSKTEDSSYNFAPGQTEAAEFRTKRWRWAVGTSVLSKIGTALLMLIAVPIAIRSLGVSYFALYASITAMSGWLGVAMVSVGPALVIRIAKAAVTGEAEKERQVVSSAFIPVAFISSFLTVIAFCVIWLAPVDVFFNPELLNAGDNTPKIGLSILTIVFFFRALLRVMENAQAGYQEQYLLNIRGIIGNFATAAALIMVFLRPDVIIMIIAMQVPILLTQIANVFLFLFRRPFLLPRFSTFDWLQSRSLLSDGLMFSFAANLSAFLCHQFPVTVLGAVPGGESRTALFAASMYLIVSAFGLVSMICIPMWSALSDSLSRGDIHWVRQASRRTIRISMTYAFFLGLSLTLFGKLLFKLWIGETLQPSYLFFLCMGSYFIFLIWEYIHYMILVGMGRIATASAVYIVRSLVAVATVIIFARFEQDWITFTGLSLSCLIVTTFSYPLILRRCVANYS